MSMREAHRIVIIADILLKQMLLEKILELGAKGYNVTSCFGRGRHAVLGDVLTGSALVRIETVASESVIKAILDFVHEPRYRAHALSAFVDTVQVDSRAANV